MPIFEAMVHRSPAEAQMTQVLRDRRRAKALTLEQMAGALELSVRDYYDREKGRLRFTAEELGVLSRLLGLNLEAQIAVLDATAPASQPPTQT